MTNRERADDLETLERLAKEPESHYLFLAGISAPEAEALARVLPDAIRALRDAETDIDDVGYEHHVEVCQEANGYVVVTGKEGDDFNPVAFFFSKERAEQYCELEVTDEDGNTDPVAFDACAVEAVVTRDRIVCANDYTLDTHEKLRARITEALDALRGKR